MEHVTLLDGRRGFKPKTEVGGFSNQVPQERDTWLHHKNRCLWLSPEFCLGDSLAHGEVPYLQGCPGCTGSSEGAPGSRARLFSLCTHRTGPCPV